MVFGLAAFALLGAITLNRSQVIHGIAVFVTGLLLALVITNLADEPGAAPGRGIGSIVSGITPAAEGLGGRSDIWQGSVRLLDSWERQAAEPGAIRALRPVFGLGPEMYYYSYPLTANPQPGVIVVSNAHNSPFHTLLELGVAGLAAFMALAIATLLAGLSFLLSRWRTHGRTNNWSTIAMLAIVASLVGRAVEQIVGIGRVGDRSLLRAARRDPRSFRYSSKFRKRFSTKGAKRTFRQSTSTSRSRDRSVAFSSGYLRPEGRSNAEIRDHRSQRVWRVSGRQSI